MSGAKRARIVSLAAIGLLWSGLIGGASLASCATLAGCATLADSGGGDVHLPNALSGPFREIHREELGNTRTAPYALRDDKRFSRDPSVVDNDGDPNTLPIRAYFARSQFEEGQTPDPAVAPVEIIVHSAIDGRSLDRNPEVALQAEQAWEGGTIGAPSALLVDGQTWLYYAAAGGIGLATSDDGFNFSRVGQEPVLGPASAGWDSGAVPSSPSVLRLGDGRFRMFYQASAMGGASAIGEAESSDGLSWTRRGDSPALAPHPPTTDPYELAYDEAGVSAPHAIVSKSSLGRDILWLYYGARAADGKQTIGLAARYGFDAPLQRAAAPVFGTSGSLLPTEPCVLRYPGFTLLFVTQLAGSTSALQYPAVAVGVAPATVGLPPPDPP